MTGLNDYNKKRTPATVGSYLDKLLAGMGLSHQIGGWRAVIKWPEIVGDKLAEHSKAIRYSEGTLMVSVKDSVWRQELSMDSDRILEEIHKLPGGAAVKRIQLVS